jgi:hypothetical protein
MPDLHRSRTAGASDALREYQRKYWRKNYELNREAMLARKREYNKTPAQKEARNQYARRWRLTEKGKATERRKDARRQRSDAHRERQRAKAEQRRLALRTLQALGIQL